MEETKIATPEPAPQLIEGSTEVLELLKEDLKHTPTTLAEREILLYALQQRSDFGFNKYGTRLMVPNGRDFRVDTLQELADAIVYYRGFMESNPRASFSTLYMLISLFLEIYSQ